MVFLTPRPSFPSSLASSDLVIPEAVSQRILLQSNGFVRKSKAVTYAEYLQTPHWKSIRARKLDSHGSACNRCRSTESIQVHRVYYSKSWWNCRLADLEVLCESCHQKEHRILPPQKKLAKLRNILAFRNPYRGSMTRQVCARYWPQLDRARAKSRCPLRRINKPELEKHKEPSRCFTADLSS